MPVAFIPKLRPNAPFVFLNARSDENRPTKTKVGKLTKTKARRPTQSKARRAT